MNLIKEAAAIKVRFEEYFNPPKWQASAAPKQLSSSAEVKKTVPTLGTSPGRSGLMIPRSGSSPELESPRLSSSPITSADTYSPPPVSPRKRISIGRAPQSVNSPSIEVTGHSPRSTSLVSLNKDPEEQDLNKV